MGDTRNVLQDGIQTSVPSPSGGRRFLLHFISLHVISFRFVSFRFIFIKRGCVFRVLCFTFAS